MQDKQKANAGRLYNYADAVLPDRCTKHRHSKRFWVTPIQSENTASHVICWDDRNLVEGSTAHDLLCALSSVEGADAFLNGHESFASFDPEQ